MTEMKQQDFEQALNECASEPIHQIGHIQPHGAAIVLSPDNQRTVLQASENLGDFVDLPGPEGRPQGKSLVELIGKIPANDVESLIQLAEANNTATGKVNFTYRDVRQELDVHVYRSDGLFVLELSMDEGSHQEDRFSELLFEMQRTQLFHGSDINTTQYFDQIATLVRTLTGYDSVMVYRFDADWNGEIFCQSRADASPSYLGMYFPASDIPPQARRLYTINLVRVVADIDAIPVPVLPALNPATNQPLDMTYSAFRSLSPIHMEYLRNIGVRASMVVSLLHNDRLWGLIVCHHLSPKRVSIAMREAAIFIAKMASDKLNTLEAIKHRALVDKATHVSGLLHQSLRHGSVEVETVLQEMLPELQLLLDATGIIVTIEGNKYHHGTVPDPAATDALLGWLSEQSPNEVLSHDHLAKVYAPAAAYAEIASGLLAAPISGDMKNCIVWLRVEKIRTINWAGKYEEGFIQNAAGDFRLTPRKSFELWSESWCGRSMPWSSKEIGIVVMLANAVTDSLQHLNQLNQAQSDVTPEWQIASTLLVKEQKDLLAKLTLQLPGVLFQFHVFPEGRFRFPYVSPGSQEIYELSPLQVMEDAQAVFARLHPDDYDTVMASIQESARTLQPWKMEYRVRLPKKGERWLSGFSKPESLADGGTLWHGFSADITELKQNEELLRITAKRLALATKAGGVGIWDWDIVRNIMTWDDQMYSLYGITKNQFSGAYDAWRNGLHPQDVQRGDAEVQMALSGEKDFDTEFRIVWPNGEVRHIRALASIDRGESGQAKRMIGTNWDITNFKMAEASNQKALDSAQSLAQSKSEFLANMSHEIRTPMNAIIGLSQLALNRQVSGDVRDYLNKIHSSSESLLGILNDVLDFSKMEAGKLTIDNQQFNLDTVLDELNNLFSIRAAEKHLEFAIEVANDVPKDLIGDALRLQQILANLLGNALKFTERGKIALKIKLTALERSMASLHFCVCDTGIGISQEDQAYLFQPFSQVDTSATRRFSGTGLGLAISRKLLKLKGSDLQVESTPGQGSNFSFELLLPLRTEELHHQVNRRQEERQAGTLSRDLRERGKTLSGARILVAEDNVINQLVVKEFLKLSGVNVDIANNGREALQLLELHRYDAILMDVHMPEMGGIEATKIIRAQSKWKALPILALTAGVTREEREACEASGMNDVIAKPINPEALIESLRQWINPTNAVTSARSGDGGNSWAEIEEELPGFDLCALKTMIGGDSGILRALLQTFFADFAGESSVIMASIQQPDLALAEKQLHRLKGSAGNLGAKRLHQASETLDAQLKKGSYSHESLQAWLKVFDETMVMLANLLVKWGEK